ncbi:MAG: SurA N-terminal domain-containing protein [Roseinatronobacter sp.]
MAKTPQKKKMSARNIAGAFIMGLLMLSLLGFGVEGFGGRSSAIGTVGDRRITANEFGRALQTELRALQGQFGQPITMEQARLFGLDRLVLDQLVTGAVLDNETERLGISAGDVTVQQEILQISAFQGLTGAFDRETYRFALQNVGMSEREFEDSIRQDIARILLQRAVTSGATAPSVQIDTLLEFQAQTRDLSITTLTADDLPAPIPRPDARALEAFHSENIARYTMPEGKRIRYAKITPDMMIDLVEIDEALLRQAYEARITEFSQPERRLVERLVFPDLTSAEAARARIDAGEASFEDLVAERGLDLDDTDMGDVSRAELGAAGEMVFALDGPGIAGPAQTNLGPALFRMNAILAARETPFEDAREQLREEQVADLARRMLLDDLDLFEDLLAGGASLEELAAETQMELGEIDWRPGITTGVAAYESFREAAMRVAAGDFPEIMALEDGGLFTVELIEILPEAPQPLEDIRSQVTADWQRAQLLDQLQDLAATFAASLRDDVTPPQIVALPTRFDGIRRTDFLPDLPRDLVEEAFAMTQGDIRVVPGTSRVHVLELHASHSPDPLRDDVAEIRAALDLQLQQSLAQDLFGYFTASLREGTRIQLNQQVIDAVQAGF